MITIDEMQELLEEIAEEIPEAFYRELNGGINLLPNREVSPEAVDDDLFTMGEYCVDQVMGRYIVIYYGSFAQVCRGMTREEIVEELRETLYHEFTHHIESLAGEYGLEIKDEEELREYFASLEG